MDVSVVDALSGLGLTLDPDTPAAARPSTARPHVPSGGRGFGGPSVACQPSSSPVIVGYPQAEVTRT